MTVKVMINSTRDGIGFKGEEMEVSEVRAVRWHERGIATILDKKFAKSLESKEVQTTRTKGVTDKKTGVVTKRLDLDSFTLPQLKTQAKEAGIEYGKTVTKADLIQLMINAGFNPVD